MHYINYHEDMRRGTDDFPIEFYHMTKEHPRYHMSIHWHVEFEFVRVLSGTLRMTVNENSLELHSGTAAFVPSGFLHSYEPEDGCIYDCTVFDSNMLSDKSDTCRKFIRSILNHDIEIRSFYNEQYPLIIDAIWSMFDALSTKLIGYELIVKGSLLHFFGAAIAYNYSAEFSSQTTRNLRRISQIKHALEFIEANFSSPLTLQDIAAQSQMSPKYFCKFFQEMTHRTPIAYLNYYRIERACHLLLTTNQSVTEVAYNVGFNDLSYFIKLFKRYKNVTPKQYMK